MAMRSSPKIIPGLVVDKLDKNRIERVHVYLPEAVADESDADEDKEA